MQVWKSLHTNKNNLQLLRFTINNAYQRTGHCEKYNKKGRNDQSNYRIDPILVSG